MSTMTIEEQAIKAFEDAAALLERGHVPLLDDRLFAGHITADDDAFISRVISDGRTLCMLYEKDADKLLVHFHVAPSRERLRAGRWVKTENNFLICGSMA